jgi:hypothetical protein
VHALSYYSQLSEMSGNKNGVVTDDAMKNKEIRNEMKEKAIHNEIESKNKETVEIASITDSNNITNTYVNDKNENKIKRFKNAKNVAKTIISNPLHIIDENYCTGEEVSEGWTNITINKSNNQNSSVVIQELDDCEDLQVEGDMIGEKSPIIDEIEDDEENTKHIINDNQIVS